VIHSASDLMSELVSK